MSAAWTKVVSPSILRIWRGQDRFPITPPSPGRGGTGSQSPHLPHARSAENMPPTLCRYLCPLCREYGGILCQHCPQGMEGALDVWIIQSHLKHHQNCQLSQLTALMPLSYGKRKGVTVTLLYMYCSPFLSPLVTRSSNVSFLQNSLHQKLVVGHPTVFTMYSHPLINSIPAPTTSIPPHAHLYMHISSVHQCPLTLTSFHSPLPYTLASPHHNSTLPLTYSP